MGSIIGDLFNIGQLATNFGVDASKKIVFYFFSIVYGAILRATEAVLSIIIDAFGTIDKYVDVYSFISLFRLICPGIIIVCLIYRIQKDKINFDINDYSIYMYIKSAIVAVVGMFFLPWFLENIILHGTNLIAKAINASSGSLFEDVYELSKTFDFLSVDAFFQNILLALLLCVLNIGLLVITFISAFRYLELVFIDIASPIFSAFGVLDPSLYKVWFLESIIAGFSVVMNVLILKLFCTFCVRLTVVLVNTTDKLAKLGESYVGILLGIAFIALSVKGASILKRFAYKTGIGEAATGVGGTIVRFAAMTKFMI
jgi:hypothetical protein